MSWRREEEFDCARCGETCDIDILEEAFNGDKCCPDCVDLDDCPECGAWVEALVVHRPATLEEPAELGCDNCSTRPRYGSREWRLARDEATCDEKYDAWKDSGKPGGRYR
jgi:hypothetical protein